MSTLFPIKNIPICQTRRRLFLPENQDKKIPSVHLVLKAILREFMLLSAFRVREELFCISVQSVVIHLQGRHIDSPSDS